MLLLALFSGKRFATYLERFCIQFKVKFSKGN